jgi:hypothetical protein
MVLLRWLPEVTMVRPHSGLPGPSVQGSRPSEYAKGIMQVLAL